ncbi:GDP-D-glycero-alpha-D-manno-heptose dehydrogenase-like [Mercenaria mercenaria]|uniref:GDP-D-glycero-alpha-D-manno-heptose dehydrogenase-like n=1 Tax=Mercenaria mercenaria TaxID=6596 RepID=UPI00234F0A29|nr:GDP-D-glycero-alpha-D-manno-heptose dehydrogenase-like [Mercenaria mercenaria]
MRVLVTGGAGYIGSTLVPMLLHKGHEVTVYDNLCWGVYPLLHAAYDTKLRIIQGDVNDRKRIADVMADQDAIIHLAAIVGYPACDSNPDYALGTNISGTKNIADSKSSNQILIFASTGSCYGAIKDIGTEETKLQPLSLYGKSKAQGEEMVLSVGGIALRLATLFGLSPRMRLDLLINDLTFKAFTCKHINFYEGGCRRTFLHVRDAARAFVFALENANSMKGQAYNIGDEKLNMTKLQVVQRIHNLLPDCTFANISSESDKDKRDYEVSFKKISQLGYHHKISIEQGVNEMLKVFPFITIGEQIKYFNV